MNAPLYFEAWHKDHLTDEGLPNYGPYTGYFTQGFDLEMIERELKDIVKRWSFNGLKREDFVIFQVTKQYAEVSKN